jgi:formylglycine-generating enzyme required for sulfatase activity
MTLLWIGCGGPGGRDQQELKDRRERVAVLEIVNKANLPRAEVSYLTNLIRQAASRLPHRRYEVITRENVRALLPPGKKLEDCIGSCAVKTARELGAHWLLTGEALRFGRGLRVSLNLHHASSGVLRGSDVVKGEAVEHLEGPLQGSAVGLFAVLDPSLRRVAARLRGGFVFEKFQLDQLPKLPDLIDPEQVDERREEPQFPTSADLPKAPHSRPQQLSGIDFGSVDVEKLEVYERAVQGEKQKDLSAETKIVLWREAGAAMPSIKSHADHQVQRWEAFILERERRKIELIRRAEMAKRRVIEAHQQRERQRLNRYLRLKETLEALKAQANKDLAVERRRAEKLKRDWKKLSKLLPMSVVNSKDKQHWVEAFVEAYGAVESLNQYIERPLLAPYLEKMGDHLERLEEAGEIEVEQRRARANEITSRVELILKSDEYKDPRSSQLRGIEFIKIPGGSFDMGSKDGALDEQPVRRVRIKSFLMSKTEVTVGQYRKCVDAGTCSTDGLTKYSSCNWDKSYRKDHPINCVDWNQARTFAKWAGSDLPSEAEWEYAARGGQRFKYAGSNNPNEVAWYSSNSGAGTHMVGTKMKNWFELYDMSGNVWEWVLDEYKNSYSGAPRDGTPVCSTFACMQTIPWRVARGGGWVNGATALRVADRSFYSMGIRREMLGFRLRRTLH